MSRNNTGNPLGSRAYLDFEDNVKNLDDGVNGTESAWVDRFGRPRKPLLQMEREFEADQAQRSEVFSQSQAAREAEFHAGQSSREDRFGAFIAASSYQFAGDYGSGVELTEYNQVLRDGGGEFWRLSGQVGLPYITTGDGLPEGDALVPVGDAVLRQDLAGPISGSGIVAYLSPALGAVQRSVRERLSDTVSLRDFGPVLGAEAFQRATDFVFSKGGGTILIPAGEYTLEGVIMREGVYYQGESQRGCVLSLPPAPTKSMFVAEPAATFDFGGFFNLQFKGGQEKDFATADCIDFSAVNSILTFHVDGCYIEGFRRGFNGSLGSGSGNDRFCIVRHTSFWNNDVGMFTNEHAFLHSCEFRANNVGLDGRINDFFAINTRFVSNKYGVNRDGTLTNAQFFSCSLWKNSEIGCRLGSRSAWIGGRVAGDNRADSNGGYGDIGILVLSNQSRVSGVIFGQGTAATSFGGACIAIDRLAGPVSRGVDITNNTFLLSGEGVGVDALEDGGSGLTFSRISDNCVQSYGRPFFRSVIISMCQINDNSIELFEPLPDGQGVISINSLTPNQICNNVIGSAPTSAHTMETGHAIVGNLAGGVIVSDNTFRNFDAGPIAVTNGNAVRWRNNRGYQTENRGEILIEEGATQVVVPHGLARSPIPGDFYITPTNAAAAVSGAYVAGATLSNLTIRLAHPAPEGGCSFAWRAQIY